MSRDNMLAGVLRSLVEDPGRVRMLDWHDEELESALRHADVVIVDLPPSLYARTFSVIDGRFIGRTVVLLQEGEDAEALPPGPSRVVLYRPLQVGDLWAAVSGATASPPPAPEPAAGAPEPDEAAPTLPEGEPATAEEWRPAPEDAGSDTPASHPADQGLPVAESGRLIGLSGQELDPVIGPEQVAPGMDEATFEWLDRWGNRSRQSTAAQAGSARDQARQVRATRNARAARNAQRRAQAREEREARAQARQMARAEARQARAAQAEIRREQARQASAARAEERKAAQAEAAWARQVRAEERRVARAEAAEKRRVARAEAAAARAEAAQAREVQEQERRAARAAEAAARAEERKAAEAQVAEARAARQEERKAARAEARQARAARVQARREVSRQARAGRAEARQAARAQAAQEREIARAEAAAARAVRAQERKAAQAAAARERAARAEMRRGERAAARQARAARAEARRAARAEAGRERAAQAEARRTESQQERAARAEAAQAKAARVGEARLAGVGLLGVAQPVVVVVALAAVALGVAGWRGGAGPDTLADEVAVVRSAGADDGGLAVQDPRIGPIEPLHALGVGAWLRATDAGASLEEAVRAARVPSRFLAAAAVMLVVLLSLLLMRVGPGTGAAAGPGPAPPQGATRPEGRWRLGVAALAGALVALDPLLVRGGRSATGTVLAVVLALGTLALVWLLPARPTLGWLPAVAAGTGLALLASPLALPMLAVPVVAALLEDRYREASRVLAALGLGIALWMVLPIWVAGQGLSAAQATWLLGRPPGRGSLAASLAASPLSWLLVAAGLAAAILTWHHRSGARPDAGDQAEPAGGGAARLLAWSASTAAGALLAIGLGYPVEQALPFAVPAAAVAVASAAGWAVAAARGSDKRRPALLAGVGVALAALLLAQGIDWTSRYGSRPDDGLGRLVATVASRVPPCSAVNASGPDDRARLLAAGVPVTEFSNESDAHAAGVRYFVLTGDPAARGGPATPALAGWVRQHGRRVAEEPSSSYSRVELWRVDAAPLDPIADNLPVPGGIFSNVAGSACGGYRVVDSQEGAFHSGYQATGGKAVLGRPLGSVWTSDGPALQAFDTMVLGAIPASGGPPDVRPIELPPLLTKLNAEAVADANIPLPSARPPTTDNQTRALLKDRLLARAYLGVDPATASPDDWRRARDRFGRPLGLPQVMPDGAVRQLFEKVVLELPADGGPARPAALGRLAVRLGLVPQRSMRLEPVPGLPAGPTEVRLDPAPLRRLLGGLTALLALGTAVCAAAAWRARRTGHQGP